MHQTRKSFGSCESQCLCLELLQQLWPC
uniref:Solute carrier family 5 member 7 n=1 Tax=Rousettus aegyptiacus TaxID=9407 RepID=A0A7J8FMR1_ROUAE|nr:solute carrier family 5 member 7 [Rousettus aegyptiacus]